MRKIRFFLKRLIEFCKPEDPQTTIYREAVVDWLWQLRDGKVKEKQDREWAVKFIRDKAKEGNFSLTSIGTSDRELNSYLPK